MPVRDYIQPLIITIIGGIVADLLRRLNPLYSIGVIAITALFVWVRKREKVDFSIGLVMGVVLGLAIPYLSTFIYHKVRPPVVLQYDFKADTEGWGEHPENGFREARKGVTRSCRQAYQDDRHKDTCSLRFDPTEPVKDPEAGGSNAYVTVREDASGSVITAHVLAPTESSMCTSQPKAACSTARIIIFDKNNEARESPDFVQLFPGEWQTIEWDTHNEQWPTPWREVGIHFFLLAEAKGPLYVDAVTVAR